MLETDPNLSLFKMRVIGDKGLKDFYKNDKISKKTNPVKDREVRD